MIKKSIIIMFLVSISIAITFFCQKEGFKNRFVIQDDVTQYIPAVYAFTDSHLNQAYLDGDLMLEYMVIKNSPGHLSLYLLAANVMDPLIMTKILPFLLCTISVIMFYMVVKRVSTKTAGFFAAFMFVFYVWTSKYGFFSGGLPKAFAFPLLLAFLYFLLEKKFYLCLLILILQVLFYPVIAVVSLLIYFFNCFLSIERSKRAAVVFFLISIVCILLTFALYRQPNEFLGDMVSLREMLYMPEFGANGRDGLFVGSFLDFLTSEDSSGILVSSTFLFIIPISLLSLLYLKGKLPNAIWHIIYSGTAAFVLAYMLLFHLFFPGRYLEFTWPLFA
jgi:hypothetical protein